RHQQAIQNEQKYRPEKYAYQSKYLHNDVTTPDRNSGCLYRLLISPDGYSLPATHIHQSPDAPWLYVFPKRLACFYPAIYEKDISRPMKNIVIPGHLLGLLPTTRPCVPSV